MRKSIIILTALFLLVFGASRSAGALDPVAPKYLRAFGFLQVVSPLPQSDIAEITSLNSALDGYRLTFKPGDMVQVPIGSYLLKVKMQNNEWVHPIQITPTEFTYVAVPGFGNLKVRTPNPMTDIVELYSEDGSFLKSFPAAQIETIPMGVYHLRVKLGGPASYSMVSKDRVSIFPNATREIVVSF